MTTPFIIEWDKSKGPSVVGNDLVRFDLGLRKGGFRTPLLESVHLVLAPSIKERFDTSDHGRWPARAPSTAAKNGGNSRPMIKTGRLRNAASAQTRWHVALDMATFKGLPGSVSYGYIHQTGSHSRHIPRREWLKIEAPEVAAIAVIFEKFVADRVARFNGK